MLRFRHFLITLFVVPAMICALTSCDGSTAYQHYEGAVWNTTFHITYRSPEILDDSVMTVMSSVERSLSPFIDSSVVTAINNGTDMHTDAMVERVFRVAKEVNLASGGMYDPTVGPLVELWGFGRVKGVEEPTQASIDSALATVGIDRCDIVEGMMVKCSPDTRFNFSSITKGYGCDLVGEMLQRNGCNDYMVEIGGEIALKGKNPQGRNWRVMVEAPIDDDSTMTHRRMSVIEVSDCGVATSGNYRNFHDFSTGRKGHTISPKDGRPVANSTLSVTIIAPNTMIADALATACMAMDADAALAMVERWPGCEALLVKMSGDGAPGSWQMFTTSGFPELQD